MFSRQRGLAVRPRPTRQFSVRRGSDRSPERPPSSSSFAVSVARSSRSGASSVIGDESGVIGSVSLPLTLFEYGFSSAGPPELDVTGVFSDERGTEFLNSPAGIHLRALEREQTRLIHQYIRRSVRLAGARVLVLGSGSSKSTASLLNRGVLSATFVDTSAPALAALRNNIVETGVDAAVEVEYVCDDAWEYLKGLDTEQFDLIIALKCVGLILSSGPDRTTHEMLDMVSDCLAPDGSFITNHHAAFSTPEWEGKPIATGMDSAMFDLATVGGRYDNDIGYTWDISHPDLDGVARFSSPFADHQVQVWHVFHFRARHPADGPKLGVPHRLHKTRAPAQQYVPPPGEFDEVSDAMIPVNNRGIKRIPTAADAGSFDIMQARPKFDGHPALLVLKGTTAVAISPTRKFAMPLSYNVTPPLITMCEVVSPNEGGVVLAVTGVVRIGNDPTDPNDMMALQSVAAVLGLLGPSGIFPSLPGLMTQLDGDTVKLPGSAGRSLTLPVDGINVVTNGKAGVFLKSAAGHTIDATATDIGPILMTSCAAIGLPEAHSHVPATGDGVWEYSRDIATDVWKPIRKRTDKTFSDTPGAAMHTVIASLASQASGFVGSAQNIARRAAA
uniref:Methyl transferase n=1 Tax=Plasmopara viticola lesion associated polymycovirus 1 TaxID=2695348 RepID=A0A6B9QU92_9VIRU|nr:methyl transferase [Plasmopara viticola lesion associated polymycovirus 1]